MAGWEDTARLQDILLQIRPCAVLSAPLPLQHSAEVHRRCNDALIVCEKVRKLSQCLADRPLRTQGVDTGGRQR